MGRDEHRSRKNSRLAQTPKQQLKKHDGIDVEFSRELQDAADRKAQSRRDAAKQRVTSEE